MVNGNKKHHKSEQMCSLLAILLILNPLSHFMSNVLDVGNIYYISYICWILLFLGNTIFFKMKLFKKELFVMLILLMTFFVGSIFGESNFKIGFSKIHVGIFICIAYAGICAFYNDITINDKQLNKLLKLIVFIGLLASIYSIFFQYQYFIELIHRSNISWNAWMYFSFFRQRNIFGEYCYLAAFAAYYLFAKSQKKLYVLFVVLFGFQIYLTNSRAALLAFVILIGMCICLRRKNKYLFVAFICITIFTLAYALGLFDDITSAMYHSAAGGTDSGIIRLYMWRDCLQYLISKGGIVCGFGGDAVSAFLQPTYGVGSSHNAYIDILFDGGIIYFIVFLRSIYLIFLRIKKSVDNSFKTIYYSFMISFLVYCFFEAGMSLFSASYFSVTASILLLFVPRIYESSGLNRRS